MDSVLKDALKKVVEVDGYKLYEAQMDAKEDLKEMTKATAEVTGIATPLIQKMIVTLYKASLEEDKAKFEEFDELYREILE